MRLFTLDGCGDYRQVWCVAFFSKTTIFARRTGLHPAMGMAISDTAEFPPTSHAHIHQYQDQSNYCSTRRTCRLGARHPGLTSRRLGLCVESVLLLTPELVRSILARCCLPWSVTVCQQRGRNE